MSSPLSSNPRFRFLTSIRLWTWAAVLLSVAMCFAVTWLHYDQEETVRRSRRLLTDLREARIDLAKGLLYLTLANDSQSPFRREEGIALLNQAVAVLNDAQLQLRPAAPARLEGSELVRLFRAKALAFREEVTAYSRAEPGARRDLELRLRLSFHELDKAAQRMDFISQGDLNALAGQLDERFTITISASVALLSLMCIGVHLAGRKQQGAIQALRASEERLTEANQFLSDLIEHSSAVVFVKDREGRYELVNHKWEEVTGMKRDQALGRTDTALFPGPVGERFCATDQTAIQTGAQVEMETMVPSPAGERVFLSTKFPIRASDGSIRGVCGMATELTARLQAERELRKWADAFEHCAHGIALGDPRTNTVLACNPVLARMLGREPQDVTGSKILSLYAAEDHAQLKSWIAQADRVGQVRYESHMVRADGSTFPVQMDVVSVRDGEGRVQYRVATTQDISERRQTDAALRERVGMIRSLLDSIPDIIFFKDLNGVYLGCNPAFAQFVGRPQTEIVGKHDHDLFAKEVADSFRDYDRRMLESLKSRHNEEWVDYPDGRRRLLDTLKTPFWGTDGQLLGVLGVSRDITGRHEAQEVLARLNQQNELILNSAAEGILGLDLEDRHIFINAAAARMLGYTVEELTRLPAHATWHHTRPDGSPYPGEACRVRRARTGEAVEQVSTEVFWRNDGTSFPVEYSSRPILEQGKVVGTVVTFSDITQRKKADLELERMRLLLSEGQRIAHVGSFEYLASTGETIWSDEEFRIYGLEPGPRSPSYAELMQRCFHPDDADLLNKTFTAAMRAGAVYELEHRIVRPDGSVRHLYDRAQPYFDGQGRLVKYLGATLDITDRKRAEESLRQRNEELVRFVYTVSHDLKSPLVTIKTFLGFLEQDLSAGDATRIEKDMNYIRKAAEKMLQMLEELLELSRVGRKTNPPEEVLLQALAREAQELVAGAIADRHVHVRVTEVPLILHGDRRRLLEVFQNLLDNAVKFMGDQPLPQVEIGFEEAEHELVLFVRDNGLGIDPRHRTKLFGLFEKLHPGTPGTGIGLALVKRIVEVHGGRIWAESAGLGQGATFRFTLAGTRRC